MKKHISQYLFLTVFAVCTLSASAQQVNTLYFLENTPVRHYINPAFNPISNFYLSLPVIGYTSVAVGNNSFSLNKMLYQQDGQYATYLHPEADRDKFIRSIRRTTLFNADMQTSILSFGFRLKDKNYLHFTVNEKINGGSTVPRDLFSMALTGFMPQDADGYYRGNYNLRSLGGSFSAYTEVGLGYTRDINEQWTVGGKLKILFGQAYIGQRFNNFKLDLSEDRWNVDVKGDLAASFVAMDQIVTKYPEMSYDGIQHLIDNTDSYINTDFNFDGYTVRDYMRLARPAGVGAGIDLGFTYKPIKQLQISAAVTDLGFIRWRGPRYKFALDNVSYDAETLNINFDDYYDAETSTFDGQGLMDTVVNTLSNLALDNLSADGPSNAFWKMTRANLNVGIDANFWDNRVGVGVYSRTSLFNGKIYEEVTLGAAFRPVHWFNIAASYSFVNNTWGTLGLGLSLVTYEGLGLFVAADYVPVSYASITRGKGEKYNDYIPYKTSSFNVAFGLNIVIGHRHDKDRDGVKDAYDLCPDTPRKVKVDKDGCPLDEDGDGVPDYLDQCPDTPEAAWGYVDEFGCPLDSDGDGVPDYLDKCPDTPEAARGMIDEFGCPLDSDGDGVPDYLDQCPGTPEAARGYVDANGCLLDSDGDGVPDYLDQCPGTPEAAWGYVDANGCPIDTDGDGVPDYLDQCPGTPEAARGYVDANGCPLDTDGDGVPDYLDKCPTQPGPADNDGCPVMKKEVRNLLKKAMTGIQFETGKAVIKKTSNPILNQIANVFIDNPDYRVEIQGHTDNVGKPELNQTLSEKRANAVREYLINAGVPAQQMTAHGYGDTMPIESNATAAGRAKNRRVEFVISFEEVSYEEVREHAQPQQTEQTTATAE